jgi:hypothetical protein
MILHLLLVMLASWINRSQEHVIMGFFAQAVPFTNQTCLTFDVILPLWGHRGPRPIRLSDSIGEILGVKEC